METVSAILEQLGKAGNIAALFASTLGVFVFLENMSSSQARGISQTTSSLPTSLEALCASPRTRVHYLNAYLVRGTFPCGA
jgi:hypothetical protein